MVSLSSKNVSGIIRPLQVQLKFTNKNEWQTLDHMKAGLSCISELQYPSNIHAYISNLEGLGIFQVRQDIYMVGKNIYEPLEEHAKTVYSRLEKDLKNQKLNFERRKIEITPFARLLIDACFTNETA